MRSLPATLMVFLTTCASGYAGDLPSAKVVQVQGVVRMSQLTRLRANEVELKVDDVVHSGDRVVSEKGATVQLLLPDGSLIDLGPETQVLVNVSGGGEIPSEAQLARGVLRAIVKAQSEKKERFRIRTRSSVLSARGTEFSVAVESLPRGTKEKVVVAEGVVDWSHGGKVAKSLTAGTQLTYRSSSDKGAMKVEAESVKIESVFDKPTPVPSVAATAIATPSPLSALVIPAKAEFCQLTYARDGRQETLALKCDSGETKQEVHSQTDGMKEMADTLKVLFAAGFRTEGCTKHFCALSRFKN